MNSGRFRHHMTHLSFIVLLLVTCNNVSLAQNLLDLLKDDPLKLGPIKVSIINEPEEEPTPNACTPRLDIEPLVVPLLTSLGEWNRSMEQRLFRGCSTPCQNGGVCRDAGGQSTMKSCVCPLDLTGDACETGSTEPLTSCDKTTCQNGGSCVGTDKQPRCSCPANIAGAFCERRSHWFRLLFEVNDDEASSQLDVTLKNDESKVAVAAVKLIDLATKLGDDLDLTRSYLRTEFESHLKEINKLAVRLQFDMSDAMATKYTTQCVLSHVMTGLKKFHQMIDPEQLETIQRFGQMKLSSLEVQAENMCRTGNHDCSPHATCNMVKTGVYTCVCNKLTLDVSMNNLYPGRRCVYDGLIIMVFVLVGVVLSTLIIIMCGCRRNICRMYRKKPDVDHVNLVNVAKNFDI